MDWFRKNPFAGGLAVLTAILTLGSLYFLQTAHSLFGAESEAYAANTAKLAQLQASRPGPTEENLKSVSQELEQAKVILERLGAVIAAESAAFPASLTPQQFQDALADRINALTKEAEGAGVALPEDFSLGFDRYRTELPTPAAAPFLGQQLESIANVASLLVKAQVKQISSLDRPLLAEEKPSPEDQGGTPPASGRLSIAPFDISFEADQANFREALNAIVAAKPVVFLRLLRVANAQPLPPPKQPASEDAAPAGTDSAAEPAQNRVVFGRETLLVNMRLASVSARPSGTGN